MLSGISPHLVRGGIRAAVRAEVSRWIRAVVEERGTFGVISEITAVSGNRIRVHA